MIWDVAAGRPLAVEWPRDDEVWTAPLVLESGDDLLLFGSPQRRDVGLLTQTIPDRMLSTAA